MMVYTDKECKCHVSNPDGDFRGFDLKFFDGKCQAFIEAHRYCPEGESYVRADGKVFYGECITPWQPSDVWEASQRAYERQLLAEAEAALANSVPIADLDEAYQEGVNAAYDKQ